MDPVKKFMETFWVIPVKSHLSVGLVRFTESPGAGSRSIPLVRQTLGQDPGCLPTTKNPSRSRRSQQ